MCGHNKHDSFYVLAYIMERVKETFFLVKQMNKLIWLYVYKKDMVNKCFPHYPCCPIYLGRPLLNYDTITMLVDRSRICKINYTSVNKILNPIDLLKT